MNPSPATQAFEVALGGLLGQPAPSNNPEEIDAVWRLTGLEIAWCRQSIALGSLRRVWNARQAARGFPLLIVSPTNDSKCVSVFGPREVSPGSPFIVNADALIEELGKVRLDAPGIASRNIEQALKVLSSEAAPGVVAHGLLTNHFVLNRLPWNKHRMRLEAWAAPATTIRGWRERLEALGYSLTQRQKGYLASTNGRPVILIHVYPSSGDFARMPESGRLPEGALIAACQAENVPWGLLAADDTLRLFQAKVGRGAATDRWLELDPSHLDDENAYLLGLLAPGSLDGYAVLVDLIEESRSFGGKLYEQIDDQIRKFALPAIGLGLGEWVASRRGADLHEPEVRREIQQASYTLLFRMLFILYAESAGHLPYMRSTAYRNASLRTLCHEAREGLDRADPNSTFLWDKLRTLTRALAVGNTALDLPAYNGSLFSPGDLPGADLLEHAEVSDAHLARALDAVGFDYRPAQDEAGLDYAQLEIGHLGAIYEGLLALRLSLADRTYAWNEGRKRFVPSDTAGEDGVAEGQLFFQTEAGGRKGGGVYYTRQDLVRHLVNQSVLPALEEHLEQVRRRAADNPTEAARLLFRFRVLDPPWAAPTSWSMHWT